MLRNKRHAGAAMVAALLTACLTAGTASGTSPGPVAKEAPASEALRTSASSDRGARTVVTLISGDRAHVDRDGKVVRVQPGPGREHIAMSVRQVGTDTYVVPSDALSLVGQGTLDRRLFNVTGLLRARYDDAHRGTVPLIVSYARKGRPAAEAAMSAADIRVRRSLPAVSGEALTAPKRDSAEVWEALTAAGHRGDGARTAAPGIARVWLDGRRKAALDRSVAQIGAPAAWKAGFDGAGVKVAVLDTGVDETHPDLKGVEIAQKNFSGSKNTVDHVGHGTHVASALAGSGAKSGKHRGVAPGAKILDAKVLDDEGSGEDSGIIAGMQWAADSGARIANLSLGGEDTAEHDPLEAAVDRISAASGILFVIAAGNEGPDASTIGSPGSAASALTVGAVDRKDRIADFSSTGPTADGSLKPDLTAPGVGIVAAKAAKGAEGTPAAPGYVSMSGTSMATPHVAGAAAVLAQRHPDWTGQRIKQALTASARPGSGLSPLQQGTGRTDLARAITQSVASEQTSVNFGTQRWPHGDDKPLTRRITYRNDGTEPVTLTLSTETTGPGGKAAPAGFFAVGTDRLSVPAGGTAGVDLTADTRIGSRDGTFTGVLVARATEGGESVRTSFGVRREAEAYDLTLKYLGTDGRPSQSGTLVLGRNVDFLLNAYDTEGDGIVRTRVPRGTYLLETPVLTRKGARATPDTALMVQPELSVTKATTVTFDARRAKPVNFTVPQGAKSVDTYLKYVLESDDTTYGSVWQHDSFKGFRTGHVGAALPAKEFSSHIGGTWQKGSTTYNLHYDRASSLHTGLVHKVTGHELALVKNRIGASAKKRTGAVSPSWETATGVGHETVSKPFALPATANTYVNTRKGVKWGFSAGQNRAGSGDDGLEIVFNEPNLKTYLKGKTYSQTFNVGVFSPKINTYNTARRMGDDLSFCIGEYTDGAGHVGLSTVTKQRTRVTVDGKRLLSSEGGLCEDAFGLPSKSAVYRISTDATRSTKVAGVTTRLVAAWTFRSRKTPADDYAVLPLSSVRFAPKLDLYSRAAAGKKLIVPLTLQGPAAKNPKSLSVQVSYNGGKSWSKAPVLNRKGKRTLSLSHPRKATSVSLKARLADKQGNSYQVTVVKAYLLK
ncbi:S8 family peptidase [Streptomyces cyaneofuscatus]|uniref:S8 family peptidase n=1 Tax=Streptomyces cyaneofuscatus TaxID=66883 RepID=A0ABZ1F6J8_9ACTN|nr:S8 family peptidase [Streptomyces cyaneofuscatus]WSB11850.1 S8 family peptidase [Streptomyces cyaneofuscatus]WSD44617.1 S8 family peptidase [Streptomyces cyaneofuscatus]